jgi:uncharacterized protein YjiK
MHLKRIRNKNTRPIHLIRLVVLFLAMSTLTIACADSTSLLDCYNLESDDNVKIRLPAGLREVSGLAVTAQDTLLVHNDEQLTIVEMTSAGELLQLRRDTRPEFQLDFEGIAVTKNRVNLISSKGVLVSGNLPFDKNPFSQWHSGLDDVCEIEGLDYLTASKALIVLCKRIKGDKTKREIRLLLVTGDNGSTRTRQISMTLPQGENSSIKKFAGSGVVYVPELDHFLVLSSSTRAIAELTIDGALVGIKRLQKKRHRQPEGIELTAAGDLLIANEGKSKSGYLVVHKQTQECSLKYLFAPSGLD